MKRPRIRRPRYADVAATLALLLAMGGTAYAATNLPKNSVGTEQLQPKAVVASKIGAHAVTTPKLTDGDVTNPKLADGSVDNAKLGDGSVDNAKLGDGSVTSTKLADGSVTNFKIAAGSVTHSKLGASSIDGSNVAANSLSLADLLGADVHGAISFSMGANTCGNLTLGVSGAQVGQLVLFTFTGDTPIPATVAFGGAKVTAAGSITVRACNVAGSSVSVSGLGIRVATFG